ncbi:MAG: hypothetical protein AB8C84_13215 [Oligoflexales bacterium]
MSKHVLWLPLLILLGCDPEGKKNCDWVLEPEPKKAKMAHLGYIPVCARNRITMKQDCRLQTTLDFAKKSWKRKFKYNDLKVKNFGIPRTIDSIKFCK